MKRDLKQKTTLTTPVLLRLKGTGVLTDVGTSPHRYYLYKHTERLHFLTDFAAEIPEFEGPVVTS